ncbi:MAG TPA: hypothetical protein PLG50_07085 [bacterium]|nr:hypothetical protein [bacterium]HQG45406.1 hypothetical protein [bacterium]HQI48400.1 hypothetical protein [bacterium]HQJ64488.1 hypothetical protein [bacterium]
MKSVLMKMVFAGIFILALGLALPGCYTQLARAPERAVNDDEGYQTEEPQESDYAYDDESNYDEDRPDTTIIIHRGGDRNVYVRDWVPTVYIDAWWYQPYWYYHSSSWWRWHHRWDPWYGYYDYWGDPWYWPSFSFYGGWGFYDPWYSYGWGYYDRPWYGGYHGYWGWNGHYWGDDHQYRNWERRPFGIGNRPGGSYSRVPVNTGDQGANHDMRRPPSTERTRRTGESGGSSRGGVTEEWNKPDTRREPVRRDGSAGTVTRPTAGSDQSTPSGEIRRKPADRSEGSTKESGSQSGTVERRTPARRSSGDSSSQPEVKRTPSRPEQSPPIERRGSEQKSTTRKRNTASSYDGRLYQRSGESRRSSEGMVSRRETGGSERSIYTRRSSSSSERRSESRSSSRSSSGYSRSSSGSYSAPASRSSSSGSYSAPAPRSSSSSGSSSRSSSSGSSSSRGSSSHRR